MYIILKTAEVWEIKLGDSAEGFFESLPLVLDEKDVLIIGSYNPGYEAHAWLKCNALTDINEDVCTKYSFGINRDEFPNGRAYGIIPNTDNLAVLSKLARLEHGSLDKQLFFDHWAAYKPGLPVVPLINHHDAFNGGFSYFSGLYAEPVIKEFSEKLGVTYQSIFNPEYQWKWADEKGS